MRTLYREQVKDPHTGEIGTVLNEELVELWLEDHDNLLIKNKNEERKTMMITKSTYTQSVKELDKLVQEGKARITSVSVDDEVHNGTLSVYYDYREEQAVKDKLAIQDISESISRQMPHTNCTIVSYNIEFKVHLDEEDKEQRQILSECFDDIKAVIKKYQQ